MEAASKLLEVSTLSSAEVTVKLLHKVENAFKLLEVSTLFSEEGAVKLIDKVDGIGTSKFLEVSALLRGGHSQAPSQGGGRVKGPIKCSVIKNLGSPLYGIFPEV